MDTLKAILVTGVTALVAVFGLSMTGAFDNNLAGVPGVPLYPETAYKNIISLASTTYTLSHNESDSIISYSATGSTITLPAVRSGLRFTFVAGGDILTNNLIIDSLEGDNIDGTLVVAGAVVDCRAEDQINFVADGDALGDFVEVYSDGSQWFIGDSGVLTSAKMTCTDPS